MNLEKEAADYQAELFQLLAEFFGRAVGAQPAEFATIENFSEEIHKQASFLGYRAEDAFSWADEVLRPFYAKKGSRAFGLARRLGGSKLVLGGGSRFLESQLRSVNGSLLYADTILIPDPVAPWMESERREEKFRHVLMLQAAHALLQLKPVVDADLPHCPVFVFPSWERVLEENDAQTLNGMLQMVADVLAHYVDPSITSIESAKEFVRENPDKVLKSVDRNHLFVGPGGPIGEALPDALARYDRDIETWRSEEWKKDYRNLSSVGKVMNGLTERIRPQYHLIENAEELAAQPLICIEQQGHYFKLVSSANSGRLERAGLLDPKTQAIINGLGSERLAWLSNVSVEALVALRQNNEQEEFRRRLALGVNRLHEAAIEDTDRVAAEICREIDSGISDHNRLIREIDAKYADRRLKWGGAAAVAAAAAFVPSLAPYLGAALPFALMGKLAWDLWDKSAEKKKQSRSLMGVLAVARSKE